jgi:Leucine-rich repeat (LRR) protein
MLTCITSIFTLSFVGCSFSQLDEETSLTLSSKRLSLPSVEISFLSLRKKLEKQNTLLNLNDFGITDENLMQVLHVVSNEIQFLQVTAIDFSNNKLSHLPSSLFKDPCFHEFLPGFDFKSVHHNFLSTIGENVKIQIDLSRLLELNFAGNEISHLDLAAFRGLSNLKTLNLSDNLLTLIDENQLKGLKNLENLLISRNPIKYFSEELFKEKKNFSLIEALQLDPEFNTYSLNIILKAPIVVDSDDNRIKRIC